MLPIPETVDWSSSTRLMALLRDRIRLDDGVEIEGRVERVQGDVCDLGRQVRSAG